MKINKAAARAQFKKDAAAFRSKADAAEQGAKRFRQKGNIAAAESFEHVAKTYRQQAEMAENYKFPKWVQ